ncbi:MAG: malonic semialdehyde reductase [Myxococcales bacterium]|nr:malonic semialdehyde reductase [Myxococcales bacterium]
MLSHEALSELFLDARTHRAWRNEPVDDATLVRVYELLRMAPTAVNSQPLRITFVRSQEAKKKLEPCLAKGNVEKTMTAPATAILAYDLDFWTHLPELFTAADLRKDFEGKPEHIEQTAKLNATLQCAYFILAARSLGLDCGPMAGFDNGKVDEAFFSGTRYKSIILCNVGHGDASKLYPRAPRPAFDKFCKIL